MDERPDYLDDLLPRFAPHVREGEWEVEVHLPSWTRLFRGNDPEGWVWFRAGEMNDEMHASQIAMLERLIADQESIGCAVHAALFKAMPKIRARFEGFGIHRLPSTDAEVRESTRLVSVYAHDIGKGSAVLGVEFYCDWDEHGIGVLWRDAAVLGVSAGDAAVTEWMAARAARGAFDFLYPLDPEP